MLSPILQSPIFELQAGIHHASTAQPGKLTVLAQVVVPANVLGYFHRLSQPQIAQFSGSVPNLRLTTASLCGIRIPMSVLLVGA